MTSPIWRYHGGDGKPLVIRSEPDVNAARTREALQPGAVFCAISEEEGEGDITYLKLQDGRGWVFDSKPGVGVLCERIEAKLWHYEGVGDGQPLTIRCEPALDAPRADKALRPGEPFYVTEEIASTDGMIFLRLADGRGWVFDQKPGLGVLCRRHEALLRMSSDEGLRADLWRYTAADGMPINIRVQPSISAPRTGQALRPGEFFKVDEVLKKEENNELVLYLHLADGRGWLFDRKPGVGVLCVRHEAPVIVHIYDVPRHKAGQKINGFFRAIGLGAFHAGVEIFGKEWSFGCQERDANGCGVFSCAPRGCEAHRYREEVPMGHTDLSEEEVLRIVQLMRADWLSQDYDLLRRNCCHFSDDLCQALGVGRIPSWVMNMAKFGAALEDKKNSFAEHGAEILRRGGEEGGARIKEVCAAGGGYAEQVLTGEASLPEVPTFRDIRRGIMKQFDCVS